eukprot:CAMPEP_0119112234 /NCGR_PEP_ID=MMETSP1180-20130426/39335_1 /TAXON_ID=3052 ORGANISM="Chlamydomonas cf sp, Strain CCMP681" /NCGR_SAMPLE_ID=MMETSP1180 /ASSEMBLY_ACC=CAM_ASM_000741 /LENGTH=208 /DNA_ID=CAMNT_0007099627 /DNA_START=50 /DNA_END=673 /DNA_ORIENTATION=+
MAAAVGPQEMTDVTRSSFQATMPHIKEALNNCSFFAIDCEMTGLFVEPSREGFLDDPQDRYNRVREAAANFVVTQLGISCFRLMPSVSADEAPVYEATTFNAYVFPVPIAGDTAPSRRFLSDAGSLHFLAGCGFDFNKWVNHGIGYVPARELESKLKQAAQTAPETRNPVAVEKPEDIAFVADVRKQLGEWLSGSEPSLMLGKQNAYQ